MIRPSLSKVCLPAKFQPWLERSGFCEATGAPRQGELVLIWTASCLVGTISGYLTAGLVAGLLGFLLGVALPVMVVLLRQKVQSQRFEQQLPDFLESVARSLRSGASLPQATVEAIQGPPELPWPLPGNLRKLRAEIEAGLPFAEVLASWRLQHPTKSVTLTAAAMSLASGVGGERAHAIDRVAHTLREQVAFQQELEVSAIQARLSAIVIASLPLVFLVFWTSVGVSSATILWETPFGLICLAGGLTLNGAGIWWMQKIVAQVLP